MSDTIKDRLPENRWTPEEDEILLSAIGQCLSYHLFSSHDTLNRSFIGDSVIVWSQVSACLPGRNNKSCRKRWIHSLDPCLRKGIASRPFRPESAFAHRDSPSGRWTEDEDMILMSAIETYGTQWFQGTCYDI